MKRTIYFLGIISVILWSACQKFDKEVVLDITEDEIFSDYSKVEELCIAAYASLPTGFTSIDGAMMASACDEAEHTLETSEVQKFNDGTWNQYANPNNVWTDLYKGIHRANYFLESYGDINWNKYKLDNDINVQKTYNQYVKNIFTRTYEVRFLRAFYLMELVKRYGGVPIITKSYPVDADFSAIKRNTLEECINYITSECDSAAKWLPLVHPDGEVGRATKVAAYALKSRALLYAASELFNNPSWAGTYSNPELISLPNYSDANVRKTRWQAAASAAKMAIDTAAKAQIKRATGLTSYDLLFTKYFADKNTEIIFAKRDNFTSNDFEKASFPISFQNGQSGTTPSQNLVDAYEVKKSATEAVPFNWNDPLHTANPYANRDPRLEMSVILNNTDPYTFTSGGGHRPLEIWTGGRDGKGVEKTTRTGYYLKKYVNLSIDLPNNQKVYHCWIFMRLDELFLNYAEALNESNPGHSDIALYINNVRTRPSVNMPQVSSSLTQSEMRNKIINERRVEFAFEDFRNWDLRRWMLAAQELNKPLRGVEITKSATGSTFTYVPIEVEKRKFNASKMYLYPIPQGEVLKTSLVQNPNW